ncbi:MAG: cbb3-type cytochrome oxidase assembly protein CcoS [Phycisphaerales bacterium]|nr:cbb3-type cytochrome oxidase assembly protein CcoS [Phycisphaerales bacterium]
MSVMYIVLPLALLFAGLAVWAFIWAVRHGQLDDLQTPAARMLLDDDEHPAGRAARQNSQARADAETESHDRQRDP